MYANIIKIQKFLKKRGFYSVHICIGTQDANRFKFVIYVYITFTIN